MSKSSQISVVRNDYTNGKLTNAYSATPYRFSINQSQLYGVLPLIKDFENLNDGFVSLDKKEVIVGFYEYIDFVWTNFSPYSKGDGNLFGNRLFRSADNVQRLFNFIRDVMQSYIESKGHMNLADCKASMSDRVKARMRDIVEDNGVRDSLKNLWESFLVNTAMLNVKSITLSGEKCTQDRHTVPIKFIPKIGRELSLLSVNRDYDLMGFIGSYKKGTVPSPVGPQSVIASLINGSAVTLVDEYNIPPTVDIIGEAESRGYSATRSSQAIERCISSLTDENEIKYYKKYLNEIETLIDALGVLVAILDKVNHSPKDLVLLDFNFHENYSYKVIEK